MHHLQLVPNVHQRIPNSPRVASALRTQVYLDIVAGDFQGRIAARMLAETTNQLCHAVPASGYILILTNFNNGMYKVFFFVS